MGVAPLRWCTDHAGGLTLGVVAALGLVSALYTAITPGIDLVPMVLGVGFPLLVSGANLVYLSRIRDHRDGATLCRFAAIASASLMLYFVLTALAIIWGQWTLGVAIENPLIVIAQLGMVGAVVVVLLGHLYGRSVTTQERLRRRTRELERQNERLDQFASVVSHDLRNPLNVATGSVELARSEGEGDHLEMAAGALHRMEVLIDDLLTLARSGDAGDQSEIVSLPDSHEQPGKTWILEPHNSRSIPDSGSVQTRVGCSNCSKTSSGTPSTTAGPT